MKQAFINWCRRRVAGRGPDKIINNHKGAYLLRWHVIPRNRFFNLYWHDFYDSDEDRANHDHPWLFNASVYVEGDYREVIGEDTNGPSVIRCAGDVVFRWGRAPHRVMLSGLPGPVRTIFITGPVVREWGFYCPLRWIHWKDFTSSPDGKTFTISKGCSE